MARRLSDTATPTANRGIMLMPGGSAESEVCQSEPSTASTVSALKGARRAAQTISAGKGSIRVPVMRCGHSSVVVR